MTYLRKAPRNRTGGVNGSSRFRGNERDALLRNNSVGFARDPKLYPGADSPDSPDSFEAALSEAASKKMDPRFNNSGSKSANRFARGSPAEKEISPSRGALQFVSAYSESVDQEETGIHRQQRHPNTNHHQPQDTSIPDTTWDAVIEDSTANNHFRQKAKSSAGAPVYNTFSTSTASLSSGRTSSSNSPTNKIKTPIKLSSSRKGNSDTKSTTSIAPQSSSKKGSRIARLASIFQNKATVKATEMPPHHPSPSRSSSSGGYVGWPGTQDKHGGTIAVRSSHDDSSTGGWQKASHYEEKKTELVMTHHQQKDNKWNNNHEYDDFSSSVLSRVPSPSLINHSLRGRNCNIDPMTGHEKGGGVINRQHQNQSVDFPFNADQTDEKSTPTTPSPFKSRFQNRLGDSFLRSDSRRNVAYNTNGTTNATKKGSCGASILSGIKSPIVITPVTTKVTSPTAFQVKMKTPDTGTSGDTNGFRNGRSISCTNLTPSSIANSSASDGFFNSCKGNTTPQRSSGSMNSWDYHQPISPQAPHSPAASSAFFNESEVEALASQTYNPNHSAVKSQTKKRIAAASVMRPKYGEHQPPTEDTLAINNSLTPPHRAFKNVPGYKGLLNKTEDVPNLMDDEDSVASSMATSAVQYSSAGKQSATAAFRAKTNLSVSREESIIDGQSDIFDEISKYSLSQEGGENQDQNHDSVFNDLETNYEPDQNCSPTRGGDNYQQKTPIDKKNMKVVLLGGGLTTIQTTTNDYTHRQTADSFDDNLTNSDVDEFGYSRVPGFHEMISAGTKEHDCSYSECGSISRSIRESLVGEEFADRKMQNDSSFSQSESGSRKRESRETHECEDFAENTRMENQIDTMNGNFESERNFESEHADDNDSAFFSDFYECDGALHWSFNTDLSEYYVHPRAVKKLVRKYRDMCKIDAARMTDYEEIEKHEDEKKAFALFEMRSRIMEKDIEQGLERRGGTVALDDLALTPYYRSGLRVRDAVIVSKAWRDGASPLDVMNTARLTCRAERTFYVKRQILTSDYHSRGNQSRFNWEQVDWVDDADFMQYRCPSLGPRNMRGFEMFTIGDCQSILLRLTNERCMELREELNEATARQIDAEEQMKEEVIHAGDRGMMTEAEMTYLAAMEDVKTISKQLVTAEKAFTLVKDRIEKLVHKYESLLTKIENNVCAASSVVSYESSYYSDAYSGYSTEDDRDKQMWARRAQRAEVRAEVSAREAYLSRQGSGGSSCVDQQRELERLEEQLEDLQSEPSTMLSTGKQHSVVLAKAIAMKQRIDSNKKAENGKIDDVQTSKENLKKRFRDRMAAKKRNKGSQPTSSSNPGHETIDEYQQTLPEKPSVSWTPSPPSYKDSRSSMRNHRGVSQDQNTIFINAGEEMFQHLDFYERSLKAVNDKREVGRFQI